MTRHPGAWAFVVIVDIAAAVLGPVLDVTLRNDAAFQITYGVAAVGTFLGLLPIALDRAEERFGFRELIASAFIVIYLMLVTAAAFFHKDLPEGNITAPLVSNFTTITGVVVGAYFLSNASDKFTDSRSRDSKDSGGTEGRKDESSQLQPDGEMR